MLVRFVLDENLRGKPIWHALRRSAMAGPVAIDAVRVGDPPDLLLGSTLKAVLQWLELVVTDDQPGPVGGSVDLHPLRFLASLPASGRATHVLNSGKET
ncbi:MAG: hypothetical protein JO344_22350 [Planctomycetaceae bacterium]|nr:hypothetical protein [Planctomycetaceae bacterium]